MTSIELKTSTIQRDCLNYAKKLQDKEDSLIVRHCRWRKKFVAVIEKNRKNSYKKYIYKPYTVDSWATRISTTLWNRFRNSKHYFDRDEQQKIHEMLYFCKTLGQMAATVLRESDKLNVPKMSISYSDFERLQEIKRYLDD